MITHWAAVASHAEQQMPEESDEGFCLLQGSGFMKKSMSSGDVQAPSLKQDTGNVEATGSQSRPTKPSLAEMSDGQGYSPPVEVEEEFHGTLTLATGSNFRALPKRSCDDETKALHWYSYDSRAAAEEACLAEGCGRLGTKQEQTEYGSLCSVLWSSDAKGYHMIGTHNGCGHDGWNGGGGRTTAGAFCAECPDCPASEEESGTPEEESGTAEEESGTPEDESGTTCRVNGQYNSMQAPVENCRSDAFPVGSHFCLHGEKFTVASSWNTGGSGATVNIVERWPSGDFFKEGDLITPMSSSCGVQPTPTEAPATPAPTEASAEGDGTPEGSNFRPLPKRSCDDETKALQWYSYDSRAAAEEACLAEGCGRLGTKQEQTEYGSLCSVLWSSDAKGYHMIGKHKGCGHDGWNGGGGRTTAGAFCAECHDCPASEEESVLRKRKA